MLQRHIVTEYHVRTPIRFRRCKNLSPSSFTTLKLKAKCRFPSAAIFCCMFPPPIYVSSRPHFQSHVTSLPVHPILTVWNSKLQGLGGLHCHNIHIRHSENQSTVWKLKLGGGGRDNTVISSVFLRKKGKLEVELECSSASVICRFQDSLLISYEESTIQHSQASCLSSMLWPWD